MFVIGTDLLTNNDIQTLERQSLVENSTSTETTYNSNANVEDYRPDRKRKILTNKFLFCDFFFSFKVRSEQIVHEEWVIDHG